MSGRALLGAADIEDATLAGYACASLGLADGLLVEATVEEFPYALESITTAGRYVVRGRVDPGSGPVPFELFVKVVRTFSRSPLFAVVPAHLREMAEASVPWRTEALAYRSDLASRLPAGLTMPRCVGVHEVDAGSTAIWLELLHPLVVAWDAQRYTRAARLLGRLAGSPQVAELARVGQHPWTLETYRDGRLRHQVVPMLHDDSLWEQPLVVGAFDPALRARMVAAAARVDDLVEEALSIPHTVSHGDACPNNLLATAEYPDFTLIDYGFWMPQPVGADLGQLLIGEVQLGRQRAGDLRARDEANLAAYLAGLRDEACDLPEATVRRGHAIHLLLLSGLSAMPWELAGREPTPELRDLAADRAAIARFCLDRLDDTGPRLTSR